MPKLSRARSLLVVAALAVVAAVGPAAPSSATSNDPCNSTFGLAGFDNHRVPSRNNPYIPEGGHMTDCRMYKNMGYSPGVLLLQRSLVICYGQNISADGYYGDKTMAALKNVQAQLGIQVDGLYGNETRDHINFFRGYFGPVAYCAGDPYFPQHDVMHY
ncbi:peptidoglycan-binding domain-containing protein [Cellulomonas algicola]|uniref:peptidoglycan-binding domain-containing protein n=1 Tax=Cellulomonas algicola TaxID=2071633 RepID=UPI001C3F4ED1|nr:peptidoglycan-binding domain-containing protein [Cellulomonas algicola]